jgi:hypothetical protein
MAKGGIMIKNFDTTKAQLRELAEVINAFKSEAVQLRLVELVFDAASTESNDDEPRVKSTKERTVSLRKPRKAGKKTPSTETESLRGKTTSRPGGKSMLDRLVKEAFFKKPKTIKQVVEHCDHNLAFKYKQTDFSGPLGRLTRNGALTRKKNADKQYEYSQS